MSDMTLPHDPLWPRASAWIVPEEAAEDTRDVHLALLGVPSFRTSITPTGAHATPDAIRGALARYSTYAASRGVDLRGLVAVDLGDVDEPDGELGEERTRRRAAVPNESGWDLLVALGGDNSLTYATMRGLFDTVWPECGLVTVDAHHDLRDGESNGSPVRRLIEAGLPAERVVQIGIADFANSAEYSARARDLGITIVTRAEVAERSLDVIVGEAMDRAGAGSRPVYVDLDVDVCDRAVVPGCPSAVPGGLSARELREMAFLFGRDPRVRGIDITEIDATADTADERTVRLAALLVLEAAAGLCVRLGVGAR